MQTKETAEENGAPAQPPLSEPSSAPSHGHGFDPKHVALLTSRICAGPGSAPLTCEYYLVGTAHVSSESCDDVREVIRKVKPQYVMLELCPSREALLHPQKITKSMTLRQALDEYKKGQTNLIGATYSYMLSRLAEHLEVLPGEEFRVAFQEARSIGAKVFLGDRNVNVTLARTWAALSTWEKFRFIGGLLFTGINLPDADELASLVEEMKNTDLITETIKTMGKEFPSLLEPLIYERDRYMVASLRSLEPRATRVVAVVGLGHIPGMRDNWEKEINISEIQRAPDPPAPARWISWRTSFLVAGCTAAGVYVFVRWRR